MRSKEFVQEIIKIPRSEYPGNESDIGYHDVDRIRGKPLDDGIKIYFKKPDFDDERVAVLAIPKYDRVIGSIKYSIEGRKKSLNVHGSAIDESFRGQGIMTKAYKALMLHHKAPIAQSGMQTIKAQKLWANLRRDPEIEVLGFIDLHHELYPNTDSRMIARLKKANAVKSRYFSDSNIYVLPVEQLKSRILGFRKGSSFSLYDSGKVLGYNTGLLAYPKSLSRLFR